MELSDGLYDLLLTESLARSLAALDPGSAEVLTLKGGASSCWSMSSRVNSARSLTTLQETTPTRPTGNLSWSTSCW